MAISRVASMASTITVVPVSATIVNDPGMASTSTVISLIAAMVDDLAMAFAMTFNSSVPPLMATLRMGTPMRILRDLVLATAFIRPLPLCLSGSLQWAEQQGQHSDTQNNYFPHVHVLTSLNIY